MARVILVLGGARSGKSRYAEQRALAHDGPRTYIATATAADEEMHARIAEHRRRREGGGWSLVEEPLKLCAALRQAAVEEGFVLVDCLTLWISNMMLHGTDVAHAVEELADLLPALPGTVCLVSNEVGLGIVPDNALARAFRDEAGFAHQMLAQVADEVVFMIAGLPMVVKGQEPGAY